MTEGEPTKLPPRQVTLECWHDASYLAPVPNPGEVAYCRVCRDYRRVRSDDEVWVRCESCTLARRCGQDAAGALRMASKHAITHDGHITNVHKGREILSTVSTLEGQGELPYDRIISTRREVAQAAQRVLRGVTETPLLPHSMYKSPESDEREDPG